MAPAAGNCVTTASIQMMASSYTCCMWSSWEEISRARLGASSWSLIQRREVWALCSVGVQNQAKAYWRREKKRQEESAWENSWRGRRRSFGAARTTDQVDRATCVKLKVSQLSLTEKTSSFTDSRQCEACEPARPTKTICASLDVWVSNKWGGRVSLQLIVQFDVQNSSTPQTAPRTIILLARRIK